jgi:hypothetical protein
MNDQILRNALITPDGTVIESTFRHDYVTYEDANGKTYMVDGGKDYLRRSANGDEVDDSVLMSDPHEKRRLAFFWRSFGKDGKGPIQTRPLAELSDNHIEAILETQLQIRGRYPETLMLAELEYRR